MKNTLILLLLALLVLPLRADAAQEHAYYMFQNLLYEGPLKIYLSGRGSRVQMNRLAIYLPFTQKDALVFNPGNRKFCSLNQQVWLSKLAADNTVTNIQARKTSDYHGHRATQYFGDATQTDGKGRCQLEFWTARDFSVPQKVQDDYCRLLGLPTGYGLPLAIIRHYPGGKNETFLGTYEIKSMSVDALALTPPTNGYQRVADEMDVIFGE